jgi:hypothetical protein
LKNFKISHNSQTVDAAAPYKNSSEGITTNTKHIIQQNNFTNINLNTIEKKMLEYKNKSKRLLFL